MSDPTLSPAPAPASTLDAEVLAALPADGSSATFRAIAEAVPSARPYLIRRALRRLREAGRARMLGDRRSASYAIVPA